MTGGGGVCGEGERREEGQSYRIIIYIIMFIYISIYI